MKFAEYNTKEFLKCEKCEGVEFTELKPTNTNSHQVWCKNEKCKVLMLIPVKKIFRGEIIKVINSNASNASE